MNKRGEDCVLYDRKCIECGECDMCDIDRKRYAIIAENVWISATTR